MTLTAADFGAFFQAIHGYRPFGWQSRLAAQVLKTGWPSQLDLPTGVGKTTALDIALFALAVNPEQSPRRIVLVVDRRVVVNQAFQHAKEIVKALDESKHPVVAEVRLRLRALIGDKAEKHTVATAELRGGMPREVDWARRPDQALLAVSTVDQVGSRLLFRGYGVSERMSPVHAGLFGNDALILLDEVHLSTAFAETLSAIGARWRGSALPDRWRVVTMSATPGEKGADDFPLDAADHQDPVLAPRLNASKPTQLVPVEKLPRDTARANGLFAKRAAEEAMALIAAGARTVAVVVNRVDTARAVWAALDEEQVDRALLTGRMRPLDRDKALCALLPRVKSGRDRDASQRPLIVAATQCIEAGADFDFDGLVSEIASLDALRQRFGRLDRRGELGVSPGRVLTRNDAAENDPVYGPALLNTAAWLTAQEELDFGPAKLSLPQDPELLRTLLAPRVQAPILLPTTLDLWAQTHPRPWPDPDVAPWLHGPQREQAQVSIVWRADITEEELKGWDYADDREPVLARLDACPPASLEALGVPIGAARAWLSQTDAVSIADVEGERSDEQRQRSGGRLALRIQGDERTPVDARELRPGDVVVVPTSYGGLQGGTWDPACSTPVEDPGDVANWTLRGRAVLRLGVPMPEGTPAWPPPPAKGAPDEANEQWQSTMHEWLDALQAWPKPWPAIGAALQKKGWRLVRAGAAPLLVAKGKAPKESSTEDDNSSYIGAEVTLRRHCSDVQSWARGFGERLRLDPKLVDDLALAGWFHDIGKADPRFQRMLLGGNALRHAMQSEPLAKSPDAPGDRSAREQARRRAGYPAGVRHELMSLAMLGDEALKKAHDPALVMHLVASHHGYCRPFAPPVHDNGGEVQLTHGDEILSGRADHTLARLGSGVAERFWHLNGQYGWWGLAWLEAILRLADHRASEEEAKNAEAEPPMEAK